MKRMISFLKNQSIISVALIGAVVLILCSLISFDIQVNRDIQKEMRTQADAIQKNCSRLLQNEMDYLTRLTETTAEIMTQAEYRTDSDIVQTLEDYARTGNIVRALFVTMDGHAYTSYAGYLGQSDSNKAMDGTPLSEIEKTTFSQPFYSEEMGQVIFGVVSPVTMGGRKGILVSSYDVNQFYKLFKNEFLGGAAEIGVINNKGEVVVGRQPYEFMLNIFDAMRLNKIEFSSRSVDEMQEDITGGSTGFSTYFVNGTERYCSYAPVERNGWYVIVLVQESALRAKTAQLEQYGVQLTIRLVVVMAVLMLIIIAVRFREQKRVRVVLQEAAMIDGLTGIYNRGTVESKVMMQIEGNREQRNHVLFLMDIDNFKDINDSTGHIFGDFVLKELAKLLQDSFKEQDIIGRMGGDEFIVLMKDCADEEEIRAKAEQIINGFYVTADVGAKPVQISISIGIARFGTDGQSFMELYQHADDALYRAKQQGKSQFSF